MKTKLQVRSLQEAKDIVSKIYDADKSGGMIKGKKGNKTWGFSGSAISAIVNKKNDVYDIEISSSFYCESSIKNIIKY